MNMLEVHDIRETLAPEGLMESVAFVVLGEKQVEEGDNGAFKLGAMSNVHGGGCFPNDTDSQMLMAMDELMPEPRPYSF